MPYRNLFIFVEGDWDERFFTKVIKPKLSSSYQSVAPIKYARLKKEKVIQFIHSINSMSADYFFTADINEQPCIISKKQELQAIYNNRLDLGKLIIVIKEIESWYRAGLKDCKCIDLKIPTHSNTNDLTKEQFESEIPKGYDSRTFKLMILGCYSTECAEGKNSSFQYLMSRCN